MLISRSQIVAIEKDLASGHGPNSEVIARPTVRPHSERTGGQRKTPPLPEEHPVDPALPMFKRGDPHRGATHAPTAGPAADLYSRSLERMLAAAKNSRIDPEALERLKQPRTILEVSVPVRMDDGTLRIFRGYRVQHDDSRGPMKGGLR